MVLVIIILLPLLLFTGVATPVNSAIAEVEAADSSTYTLSINLNNNLLSIEAERAPLEIVLAELSEKTGARFIVNDDSFFAELLSVSFRDLEFSEAVARVLKNFSYLVETGDDNKPGIIIFASKGSGELFSGDTGTEKQRVHADQTTQGADKRPETLDECRRLAFSREDVAKQTRGLSPKQEKQITGDHDRELTDARIERAREGLGMQRGSHLWEHAIEEIKNIQDKRVTSLLTDLAEKGEPQIRGIATKALWYNVASSTFKNTEGISALKRLTGSSDQNVSMFAKEALQDYERNMRKAE